MERQWSLVLLALCLVLAFSVSPVEGAKEKGPRCSDGIDNDGDGTADCGAVPGFPADPNCDCGGGDDATQFSVEVLAGDVTSNWLLMTEEDDDCDGRASENLIANFHETLPPCGEVTVFNVDPPGGGPLLLYLYQIHVRNTKRETSVRLWFTSDENTPFPVQNETVYASDRLLATIEAGPAGSSFQIRVNETDKNLIKGSQPDKGEVVGLISVGKIVYYPEIIP